MSDTFTVKDSGQRAAFTTGAVRDTEAGKPRYDLISPFALRRLAEHMRKGAEKYEARNWEKGIPTERLYSSALRHLMQWAQGDRSEDHLSAVLFNIAGIVHFEEKGGNPADPSPAQPAVGSKNPLCEYRQPGERMFESVNDPHSDVWVWNPRIMAGRWIGRNGKKTMESWMKLNQFVGHPDWMEISC